jgi:tight adherence protein B
MNPVIIGGIVVLVLVWVGFIAFAAISFRRQSAVEERLGEFTRGEVVVTPKETQPRQGGFLVEGINRAVQGRGFADKISRSLARADLKITVGEYLALHPLMFIGIGAVVAFLRQDLIAGLIAGGLSLFAPNAYVGWQQGQRLVKFDAQLADMLNLVVNGLRAGYSVNQALESVSREMPPPISVEFKRVVQEMQLGVTPDTALSNLTRRIPSQDLDFVVTAMNVQREVGGNLSEILDTISHTIRERVRIKGEIQTLTAQGMMTGYVISGLPIALGLFLYFINPKYMGQFLINDKFWLCGYGAICLVIVMIVVGFSIVMKIVDIEV